ncbi:MAG: DoxX family protein [Bacteroidota bacterium]
MEETNQTPKGLLWASYILQGIVTIMFLMGAFMNLLQTESAIAGATSLGYPETSVVYLGIVLLVSTILYVIPKTSILGALLLTGWLGGAVASHVIHGDPMFNTMFPIVFGVVIWLSLWLRDQKLKAVFPFKS